LPGVVDTWDVDVPIGSTSGSSLLRPRRTQDAGSREAGDSAAFAELYRLHHQALYRYCLSILRHEQDAQDALQNTMIKAHQALADDGRDLQMRPWLFRVAHNECISSMRRRRGTTELADDLPAAATTEERHAEREELRELERDLAELPERQRSALVLRELSGLSHDEIAAVLGVSPAVVKSTIFEARSALLQFRDGRDLSCTIVREALSDGDKRVLRGRRQRAHLRDCGGCRAFRDDLLARPNQLAALAPPLPAAAAAALLHQLLGGAGAAGSLAAFSAGSAGSVAATSTIAAVGGGSAGVSATVATSSILSGVAAKVAATAAVTALAVGGTATVQSVRSTPDGGAAPASRSGGASQSSRSGGALGNGGAASVSRRGTAGATAGVSGTKPTNARAGVAKATTAALAAARRQATAAGSSKRSQTAGGSATGSTKAAGTKGATTSSSAKASKPATTQKSAPATPKPATAAGTSPATTRPEQPARVTRKRPVSGRSTLVPGGSGGVKAPAVPTPTPTP
jgi:RNA polymerase sigma factor (sigma-70 family)